MLFAYFNKPIRDTVWKEWESDEVPLSIDDSLFPDLTWEDEPLEVMLTPVMKSKRAIRVDLSNRRII